MSPEKVALTILFVCVILFFFSLALFPVAITTYCSKRHIAAIFAGMQTAIGIWSFAHKKATSNEGTLSFATTVFALFGIGLNLSFIIYATHLCHQMNN